MPNRQAASNGVTEASLESAVQGGLVYVSDTEPGFRRRRSGKGFVYLDSSGNPIRDPSTLARIRALVRRRTGRTQPDIVFQQLVLRPAAHEATFAGRPLPLSAKEFALLQALMDPPGQVVSRAALEEKLYGWNDEIESNAVEVYIHHLRKKLGTDFIKNVRGVGYKVAAKP